MTLPLRILLTVGAYLVLLPFVAGVAFVVVVFLAGPHAGLLPEALEVVILILGWLAVLILPFLGAWKIWKRTGRTAQATGEFR